MQQPLWIFLTATLNIILELCRHITTATIVCVSTFTLILFTHFHQRQSQYLGESFHFAYFLFKKLRREYSPTAPLTRLHISTISAPSEISVPLPIALPYQISEYWFLLLQSKLFLFLCWLLQNQIHFVLFCSTNSILLTTLNGFMDKQVFKFKSVSKKCR